MPSGMVTLIIVTGSMFALFIIISTVGNHYSLNRIKNKTVGQGQHGTARWATKKEIKRTYKQIDFQPNEWRNNPESRPTEQGIVVGCKNSRKGTTAMVDTGDVHALMIGAAGVGKTAYWLYPCIEYACATGMSFLSTDTKGDVVRNYGTIAEKYYGYKISVIDLRNPTRSHGNNLLHLVNKYMDYTKPSPNSLFTKQEQKSMQKSFQRQLFFPVWTRHHSDKTHIFMMPQRDCLLPRYYLLQSFVNPKSDT